MSSGLADDRPDKSDRLFQETVRDLPLEANERWTVFIFGIVVGALFVAGVFVEYEPRRLSALVFVLAWIPLLVLHELGHAIAARLVGWRVCQVVIGMGRTIGHARILGIDVELKSLPTEGFMVPAPRNLQGVRWKDAFVSFAGPGVEIALVVLALVVVGWEKLTTPTDDVALVILQASCLSAAVGIVLCLVPHGGSDGQRILRCWSRPREYYVDLMRQPVLLESQRLARAGKHEERVALLEPAVQASADGFALTMELVQALAMTHRFREARALYRDLAERYAKKHDLEEQVRGQTSPFLVLIHLAIQDDEASRELDALARALHERDPTNAEATALWGAVQATVHDLPTGIRTIESSYPLCLDAHDRRRATALHAFAELRVGTRERARQLIAPLAKMRAHDWFVDWVSREVEGKPAG